MICIIIALTFIWCYLCIMISIDGHLPESISETYYKGGGTWFIFVMMVSGILTAAGLLSLSEGSDWQFLSFFSGAGMCFVGASPLFKNKGLEQVVHYTGAIVVIFCSQMWILAHVTPWLLLSWLTAFFWGRTKKYMFWLEITAITTIGLAMIFV